MEGMMHIEIKNWDKYNPRKELKSTAWLRLENNFFSDPKFFALDNNAKMLWFFMLCESSKAMSSKFLFSTQMAIAFLKLSAKEVNFSISNLLKLGVVVIHDTRTIVDDTRTIVDDTLRTNERTNERTNIAEKMQICVKKSKESKSEKAKRLLENCKFDFITPYEKYPSNNGRADGMIACVNEITNQDTYGLYCKAVNNYIIYLAKTNYSPKNFSTFVNNWEDFIEVKNSEHQSKPIESTDDKIRKLKEQGYDCRKCDNSGRILKQEGVFRCSCKIGNFYSNFPKN